MHRIITDIRFNNIFVHEIGTIITVTWQTGTVVEYKVRGRIYYTSSINLKKYSNEYTY